MSGTQNKWVLVSERLPEDVQKPYLVLTNDGKTPAVAHRGKGGSWFTAFGSGNWIPNVTHWMDLPEPPAPPKPADPFEAWWGWWGSHPITSPMAISVARDVWNAAKEHYAKPLPDFEMWWRNQPACGSVRTIGYHNVKDIWNAAQGKLEV